MNLEIGGGGVNHPGWLNLDAANGFALTPACKFPLSEADIVYSSHCLEHLDDATVDRVLSEARYVCKGNLVLKLPDFEQVLERWRAGDEAYFDQWGQAGVWPTWKNLGVPVNIDSKAAMIFCGWWNDVYGDEFGGRRNPNAPGAYHGPVPVNQGRMKGTLSGGAFVDNGIHWIAGEFKTCLTDICEIKGAHLNHQNAWSRAELCALLLKHGFAVASLDKATICERFPQIPGIRNQYAMSMYVQAK